MYVWCTVHAILLTSGSLNAGFFLLYTVLYVSYTMYSTKHNYTMDSKHANSDTVHVRAQIC